MTDAEKLERISAIVSRWYWQDDTDDLAGKLETIAGILGVDKEESIYNETYDEYGDDAMPGATTFEKDDSP